MKKWLLFILLFVNVSNTDVYAMGNSVYVNPLIGTALRGDGGVSPFVCEPFSMTNFTAQTRENKMSYMPYVYDDPHILGFLGSRQPAVWMGDYGYVSVMPQIGKQLKLLPKDRALKYSHKDEISKPYYYSVKMDTGNGEKIVGEIAAASKCALLRFTFPKSDDARLIVQGINLNPELSDWCNDYQPRLKSIRGWMKIDPEKNEIIGYNPDRHSSQLSRELPNFKGYFIISFNKEIDTYGTWDNSEINPNSLEQTGTRMGAYINFKTQRGEKVIARVATSFISFEQARENLAKEIVGYDFDALVASTQKKWDNVLSKIEVDGCTDEQKRVFYSALYHCYLYPRDMSEGGKYYSAADDSTHKGSSYTDFSLWDTFRAYHPLMTLLEPTLTGKWINSFLQTYQQCGWMPIWPNPAETNIMIGTHADAVVADAFMKGIRNYDVNLAYEAMRKNAMVPPDCDTQRPYGDRARWTSFEGRAGASYYHSIGYIPFDKTAEAVSRTLEYSLDDWCIAQVAKELGHDFDYKQLMRWSRNYKNMYCHKTGFMQPRKYNGEWISTDNQEHLGMTEGSKWTYLFCVMQDIEGMIELMGGPQKFSEKLDRNFNEGHYRHDNEPGHHYIYLYNYCGQPHKAQELIRKYTSENYKNAPDGLCGNDDLGQMSAWYIFSVMGFYPVTPASNEFAIGAPQFSKFKIKLPIKDGKPYTGVDEEKYSRTLTIVANGLSEKNKYVKRVSIDGKPLEKHTINYFDLINAKVIKFEMHSNPI
ncbi:GH92 family glycosyl hydrolase [Bacteroides sp.]